MKRPASDELLAVYRGLVVDQHRRRLQKRSDVGRFVAFNHRVEPDAAVGHPVVYPLPHEASVFRVLDLSDCFCHHGQHMVVYLFSHVLEQAGPHVPSQVDELAGKALSHDLEQGQGANEAEQIGDSCG